MSPLVVAEGWGHCPSGESTAAASSQVQFDQAGSFPCGPEQSFDERSRSSERVSANAVTESSSTVSGCRGPLSARPARPPPGNLHGSFQCSPPVSLGDAQNATSRLRGVAAVRPASSSTTSFTRSRASQREFHPDRAVHVSGAGGDDRGWLRALQHHLRDL